jgi:pimeloyl-ACP methyl ester carboxylesterase
VLAPPSYRQRSRELLLGRDVMRAMLRGPGLRSLPRGDGAPVVLISGFGGSDQSLYPFRRFLHAMGHDARPAGLGRVGDDVAELYGRVARRAEAVRDETGRTPAMVGWSIGGVLAREAARDHPELVRRVITFGTPVEGGPSYTALAFRYGDDRLAEIRAGVEERAAVPITVPITAIWSRNDGIVTPEACIDERNATAENVEVSGTHIGMGIDPDVWTVVARRLADDAEDR